MRTNLMGYPKAPVKAAQTTGSKMTTSTGKINNKPPTQTNLKENVSGNQKPTHGARFADPDYMEPESKAYGRFTQEPPSYKQTVVPSQPSKVQPKPQSASQKGRNEPPVNSYFGQPEVQYGRNDRQIGSHMMQPEVQTSSRNNVAVKQSIMPNEVKKPQRPMSSKAPVQSSGRGPAFREPMVVPQNLEECRECGRKFNEKALAKHEKICKKVFSQKRKVFNSAKQRIVSKEQVQINKRTHIIYSGVHNKYESSPQKRQEKMPKWKQ